MKIAIYRYYNYRKEKYGVPFGLCETHERDELTNPPPFITEMLGYIEKLSDDGRLPCNTCEAQSIIQEFNNAD